MPGVKRCYYEVLEVERNATDDEIKKSFRRLALQLHPDKNPDRADEAKTEFQVLQRAYEVLSNPQERSWYNVHRQAVLREGLDPDFDEFNIDLMSYCTSSSYSGFGDDDKSFFTVYRQVFEKIAAEELDGGWAEEHDEDIPNFGDSLSFYDEIVGPFYAFWESFCSIRSFAWNDEYDTRRAGCRRVARLMDKENKKVRSEARKAWNREVRALVDFVKRKDKRVQAWKIIKDAELKAKEEMLAMKAEEEKNRRRVERKKMIETAKTSKSHVVNQEVLKEMEQWMCNEFGEQKSDQSSDDEDPTCLHCAACNKSFRSEKAFSNHEKSKKHLAQVEKLRILMKEEEDAFNGDPSEEDAFNGDPSEEEVVLTPVVDDADNDIDSENENDIDTLSDHNASHDEHSDVMLSKEKDNNRVSNNSESDFEDQLLAKAISRNKKGPKVQLRLDSEPSASVLSSDKLENPDSMNHVLDSDDEATFTEKSKKKKRRNKQQSGKTQPQINENDTVKELVNDFEEKLQSDEPSKRESHQCMVCKTIFFSRSQLFRHINATGHAIPISITNSNSESCENIKSKKKKRNKNKAM